MTCATSFLQRPCSALRLWAPWFWPRLGSVQSPSRKGPHLVRQPHRTCACLWARWQAGFLPSGAIFCPPSRFRCRSLCLPQIHIFPYSATSGAPVWSLDLPSSAPLFAAPLLLPRSHVYALEPEPVTPAVLSISLARGLVSVNRLLAGCRGGRLHGVDARSGTLVSSACQAVWFGEPTDLFGSSLDSSGRCPSRARTA